jgi:hypothetical protein
MKYKINGDALPTVELSLDSGESIYSESGSMAWMSSNITMETNTKGGILKGIGRMFAGESLFVVNYTSEGKGKITFAAGFPGKIIPFKLKENEELIFQKDGTPIDDSTRGGTVTAEIMAPVGNNSSIGGYYLYQSEGIWSPYRFGLHENHTVGITFSLNLR